MTKTDNFDGPAVLGLIQSSLPEAIPVPGTRGDHATYRLPLGRSSEVAAMMMELTERADQVGVAGGALESTTLEEIFMQFAGTEPLTKSSFLAIIVLCVIRTLCLTWGDIVVLLASMLRVHTE